MDDVIMGLSYPQEYLQIMMKETKMLVSWSVIYI